MVSISRFALKESPEIEKLKVVELKSNNIPKNKILLIKFFILFSTFIK
jgi:hypothetical protein